MKPDLRPLRRSDARHMGQLAQRICDSLGAAPRPLPSRVRLAVEDISRRVGVAAGAIAIAMSALAVLAEYDVRAEPSLLDSALAGEPTRAQDVYAWMTVVSAETDAGR
jgi:hypothetical protein